MLNEQFVSASPETPRQPIEPSQPESMIETSMLPGGAVFVSPRELACLLRVSIDCVYRLAAKRTLPSYRMLRRVLFRRSDVERWLAVHRTDPRDPELWR